MNTSPYCANCRLHGWKQLEDKSQLQRCKNCKVVEYCGKDCQKEHWKKVHKDQCDHFVNNHEWGHKEADCLICRQVTAVGKSQLKKPDNPNYGCIYKEYKLPPSYCHPRPFPITGQPEDLLEKANNVMWQLFHKFIMIQPGVARDCKESVDKALVSLMENRLCIWERRKDFTHPDKILETDNSIISASGVFQALFSIKEAVGRDPFELWDTIMRVLHTVLSEVYFCSNIMKALKDPQAEMPKELKEFVSQGLATQPKFFAVADQVLDALAIQVIPYHEVLKIICFGSLNQNCNFCSEEIVITDVNQVRAPSVFFSPFSTKTYTCGTGDCIDKGTELEKDWNQFTYALMSTIAERWDTRCDFCFQLPPKNDVHRCNGCLTVMYCSQTCRDQDWKIHKIFCKKDVEERKIKFGSSGRRKQAREGVKVLEKVVMESDRQDNVAKEVVGKFKMKNAKKKPEK